MTTSEWTYKKDTCVVTFDVGTMGNVCNYSCFSFEGEHLLSRKCGRARRPVRAMCNYARPGANTNNPHRHTSVCPGGQVQLID